MNNKKMSFTFKIAGFFALLLLFSLCNAYADNSGKAKYVFFFIGDGMALPQIHATEAYLAQSVQPDNPTGDYNDPESHGTAGATKLTMSQFPVVGLQTTYADNRFITGSAAAATALACGMKTTINTIAMDPIKSNPYTTIAELAREKGMKVGIVSSVSIDHATPACFYAHEPERGHYWHIADQLSMSDFDYFGGGGMKGQIDKYWPDGATDPVLLAIDRGYTLVRTKAELQAVAPGTKTFAYGNDVYTQEADPTDKSYSMPYEIDRAADNLSLADYTAEGIRLMDNPRGFFMMIESGKIDWACHANDAMAAIQDTIAFDDAVAVAVDFMNEHPGQTLIVVTGDHECGGMTLGFAGTNYDTYFEVLNGQTMSYEKFNWTELSAHKDEFHVDPWDDSTDMNADIKTRIANAFGLVYNELNDYEVELIEAAYDKTMSGDTDTDTGMNEEFLLYGYDYYEPFTITLTHILNRKAGIRFTSYAHTAVPVPVYAEGSGARIFNGNYDNTDIARKFAGIMKVNLNN